MKQSSFLFTTSAGKGSLDLHTLYVFSWPVSYFQCVVHVRLLCVHLVSPVLSLGLEGAHARNMDWLFSRD